jgi:hypothetical protein
MKNYCPNCMELRHVIVGFRGEEWCVRCNTALNPEAMQYDALRIPRPVIYNVIVFGQPERVIQSLDQTDVEPGRVRVFSVPDGRRMIVPPQHLHAVTA